MRKLFFIVIHMVCFEFRGLNPCEAVNADQQHSVRANNQGGFGLRRDELWREAELNSFLPLFWFFILKKVIETKQSQTKYDFLFKVCRTLVMKRICSNISLRTWSGMMALESECPVNHKNSYVRC